MGVDARMFVRTRQAFTPRALRNLSVEMVEAFGTERLWLWPDWEYTPDPEYDSGEMAAPAEAPGRHALRLVRFATQDGPDVHPLPGETFIAVSLWGRFYGVGYERGHLPDYTAMAEWLEARIPDARVWYGGDSSGILLAPFGPVQRAELTQHFNRFGHTPYRGGFGVLFAAGRPAPVCGFCGPSMRSNGGGRGVEFYYCSGCDAACAVDHATGESEAVTREDQRPGGKGVFAAHDRLRARLAVSEVSP